MTKTCGYSCEYNRSGICQITGCVKNTHVVSSTNTLNSNKLIKYLEDKIKEYYKQEIIDGESYDGGYNACCEDILERVKSGKYE